MRTLVLGLVLAIALGVPRLAAAEERHSGTVVSVDAAAGTVVIDELTASRSESPRGLRRTLTLAPDTRIARQAQTRDGYTSLPMSLVDLRPGDFVTGVGRDEGPLTQASVLDVVRGSSVGASPR